MRKILTGILVGLMVAGLAFAAGNVVPITDSTETLGTSTKKWGEGNIDWLRLESDDTIVNTTDDEFTFASNDTNTTLRITGYEASEAILILDADQGDDNADTFTIKATVANALEIYNHTTKIWSLSSAGAVNQVGGLKGAYVLKTANYTNTVNDFSISYTTSAVTTNTLPEASTVLGSIFCISLFGDTGDLVVMTDGTDKFDGAGNDILTFAAAGDSCVVQAVAANAYTILVNVGGALSK